LIVEIQGKELTAVLWDISDANLYFFGWIIPANDCNCAFASWLFLCLSL